MLKTLKNKNVKIKTKQKQINLHEAKNKLENHFPNYSFKVDSRNSLIVKKSLFIGANMTVSNGKILIIGNFPHLSQRIIFTALLFLLGVVLPIIVYFAFTHKHLKALEVEISNFLQAAYGKR